MRISGRLEEKNGKCKVLPKVIVMTAINMMHIFWQNRCLISERSLYGCIEETRHQTIFLQLTIRHCLQMLEYIYKQMY